MADGPHDYPDSADSEYAEEIGVCDRSRLNVFSIAQERELRQKQRDARRMRRVLVTASALAAAVRIAERELHAEQSSPRKQNSKPKD
jgi:hypothetical protein